MTSIYYTEQAFEAMTADNLRDWHGPDNLSPANFVDAFHLASPEGVNYTIPGGVYAIAIDVGYSPHSDGKMGRPGKTEEQSANFMWIAAAAIAIYLLYRPLD